MIGVPGAMSVDLACNEGANGKGDHTAA